AKGILWIASRNEVAGILGQAGPSIQIGAAGHWLASLPENEQEQLRVEDPELFANWDADWGDRMTELVMISVNMDRESVRKGLDACLLTDEELQLDWSRFEDPLPKWDEAST